MLAAVLVAGEVVVAAVLGVLVVAAGVEITLVGATVALDPTPAVARWPIPVPDACTMPVAEPAPSAAVVAVSGFEVSILATPGAVLDLPDKAVEPPTPLVLAEFIAIAEWALPVVPVVECDFAVALAMWFALCDAFEPPR